MSDELGAPNLPKQDAEDIGEWATVVMSEPLSLGAKLALQNIIAMALRRSLEAAALNEKLEWRPSCGVLRLVKP